MLDTGSFNAVDYAFVLRNRLQLLRLPHEYIYDASNGTQGSMKYGCYVPIRIGTHQETVPCLVISMGKTKTPLFLGMQWFRKNYQAMVEELLKLGGGELLEPEISQPIIACSATGNLYQVTNTKPETLLPLHGKSLLSHISKEEDRRAQIYDAAHQVVSLRAQIVSELDFREEQQNILRSCSAAASSVNVGSVNGLTGNAENWKETIPGFAQRFCDTVFSDESAKILPPDRPGVNAQIHLKEGEKLWQCKLFDMPKDQLEILKQYLDEQLAKGFISPSDSPVASPVFFVTDKASQSRGVSQLRLVVDYRTLNSKIVLDEYPIPLSREIIDRLGSAAIYTKFDVRAGFNNILVDKNDRWKLAFKTMFGLYTYNVMPMGLATAPSIFQRFINSVLAPFLGIFCFAYLDDIIIFSKKVEDHENHVTQVLEALEKANLHLKPAKCAWNTTKVDFLGFTAVAGKGVTMSEDKVQAIRNWERPQSIRDCRAFAGLANFYSKFVPHFSDLMKPIYELTKKGVTFEWTPRHQIAFEAVKAAMQNDIFLTGFDFSKPAVLETDASNVAYAGVISQKDSNGDLRPVLMFSHTFSPEQMNWPAHDKELYAIVFAMKRYRHFLSGHPEPVQVFSDHQALSKFMTTTDLSLKDRHRRWAEILSEFNFSIQYRPGKENTVADALSRYNLGEGNYENLPLLPAHRFSEKALKSLDPAARSATNESRPATPSDCDYSLTSPTHTCQDFPDTLTCSACIRGIPRAPLSAYCTPLLA